MKQVTEPRPRGKKVQRKTQSRLLSAKRFDVAVFPILNTVLFPGVSLPLHVFDRRCWQMFKDAEARGWPVAISMAEAQPDGSQQMVLNAICGAGKVQVFNENAEEGRCDVLIHGTQRVKLLKVIQEEPYYVMEAEAIEPESSMVNGKRTYEEFLALIKTWAFINPKLPQETVMLFDSFKGYGELSDFFAYHFLQKPEVKQMYLSCSNPMRRAEMLSEHLESDLARLGKKLAQSRNALLIH